MARLLVVDDEKKIRLIIRKYAEMEGHQVTEAKDGIEAVSICALEDFDVIILDVMMPGMDGLEMCRKIRETNNIPIIMLSAKSTDLDKILGLGTGADDYVVKPFLPRELTARVRAVLRRRGAAVIAGRLSPMPSEETASTADEERVIVCGLLKLNEARFEATAAGKPLKLSAKEFKLLSLFAAKPGRVFSRANLLDAVWQSAFVDERTVDVHMLRLRKALAGSAAEDMIETVRGVGYRFRDPQTALNTPASE